MVYSNFYQQLWYTPHSERDSVRPARFLIQSPSFKLYTMIASNDEIDGISKEPIDFLLLDHCVIQWENVDGLLHPRELPLDIQQDLIAKIIEVFYPTEEFYKVLSISLDILLDNKFNDTWSCIKCQEKRLDRQRNCPYLNPEEFHEPTFKLTVGDDTFLTCPIPHKDNVLVGKAMEAHRIAEQGFTPESGAYGDQTIFWAVTSQQLKEKINHYERKHMEEERAKLKR